MIMEKDKVVPIKDKIRDREEVESLVVIGFRWWLSMSAKLLLDVGNPYKIPDELAMIDMIRDAILEDKKRGLSVNIRKDPVQDMHNAVVAMNEYLKERISQKKNSESKKEGK